MSTRKNKINKPNRFRSKSLRKLRKYRRGGDGPLLDPFRPDASDSKIIPTPFRTGFPNIYNPPANVSIPEIIDGDKDTNFIELLQNDWNNTFGSDRESDGESTESIGESEGDSTESDRESIGESLGDSTESDGESIEDSSIIDPDAGIDQIDQYETADLLAPRSSISSPSAIAPSSIEIKSDIQPELLLKDIKELVFETDDSEHLNKNKINVESITDDQLLSRLSKPPEIINDIPVINEEIEQEIAQSIGVLDENDGESYVQPETPAESVETPAESTETPVESVETPAETPAETTSVSVETPAVSTETPVESIETPAESIETPTETPSESIETPAETPVESTETPVVSTETPAVSTKTPPMSTDTPPVSTETPPVSTETPSPTPVAATPIDIPINIPVTVTTNAVPTPATAVPTPATAVPTPESKPTTPETATPTTAVPATAPPIQEQAYGPQLKPINFPEGESDVPQPRSEINLPVINFPMENTNDNTPKSGGYRSKSHGTTSKSTNYKKKRTLKRAFY
jgi:hypothetical protein